MWRRQVERHPVHSDDRDLPAFELTKGMEKIDRCPFHSDDHWRRMRDRDPEAWADAVSVDASIRTGFRGIRGDVYLHRSAVPLDQVDLSTDADRGQLDLWPNECEGLCGV